MRFEKTRKIRKLSVFACIAALFVVAGCETVDTTKIGPDGVLCPRSALPLSAVYIDIIYTADGTPAVEGAQTCGVYSGTKITWRTKPGETRPFDLVFKGAHPAADDGKRDQANIVDRRYKYRLIAEDVAVRTSYKYGIRANGKEIDPEVMVDPPPK